MKQKILHAFLTWFCFLSISISYAQAPLKPGQAVSTTFKGAGKPVVYITDVRNTGTATLGQPWSSVSRYTHNPSSGSSNSWNTSNLGPVFGIALDKGGNIYVAATSSFYAVGGTTSGPGGSAGIYKIDAANFSITNIVKTVNSATYYTTGTNKLANTSSGTNMGPGLGNIAYNAYNDQLYVTNFEDGMIYRIKTDGTVLSRFDPKFGVSTSTADITNGFAPLGQRPFAVAIYSQKNAAGTTQRLYYSNWGEDQSRQNAGLNEIYSVGLDASGEFLPKTESLEITNIPTFWPMPNNQQFSNPISDIEFSSTGRMLLGERSMSGDNQITAHQSRVFEYTGTTGTWIIEPQNKFKVGLMVGKNSAGGVDYGYKSFKDNPADCDSTVWVTGDYLKYGAGNFVYGLQGLKSTGGDPSNSILIDMDGDINLADKFKLGDVDIWKDGTSCKMVEPPQTTCQEIGRETKLDTNCCQVSIPFTYSSGSGPVVEISGFIVGGSANGIFESVTAIGCTGVTTFPAMVYGSTNAGFNFSPACNSLTNILAEITPNNSTGIVTVRWYVKHKDGSVCKYEITTKCKRKPLVKCDKFSVIPSTSTSTDYDIRRFKITNLKDPNNPICKVRVKVTNFTGSTTYTHTSGDVSFDAQSQTANSNNLFFPSGSGSGYNLIPASVATSDNFPGLGFNTSLNHSINFNVNLNLNQYGGMNSYVEITAIHCDGDSCTYKYGPWMPSSPGVAGSGGKFDSKKILQQLYAASFGVRIDDTVFRSPLKWITISVEDSASEIFAISGGQIGTDARNKLPITDARQTKKMATFEFEDDITLPRNELMGEFNMVFTTNRPKIRYNLYDATGKKVISDTITIEKSNITALKKMDDIKPFNVQLSPNPAEDYVNVTYNLLSADIIGFKLSNAGGQVLERIEGAWRMQGSHTETINTSKLKAGVYYLLVSSEKQGNITLPLVITR